MTSKGRDLSQKHKYYSKIILAGSFIFPLWGYVFLFSRPDSLPFIGQRILVEYPKFIFWSAFVISLLLFYLGLLDKLKVLASVEIANRRLAITEQRLNDSQAMAHFGNMEYNLETGEVFWSVESFRLLGLNPKDTPMAPEEF